MWHQSLSLTLYHPSCTHLSSELSGKENKLPFSIKLMYNELFVPARYLRNKIKKQRS